MVSDKISSIKTLDDLQEYVYRTLCVDNELLVDAFPISRRALRCSSGELCGLMFCVHGPRTVDFTAIWERRQNRIFFYSPTGERYRQTTVEGVLIDTTGYVDRLLNAYDSTNA